MPNVFRKAFFGNLAISLGICSAVELRTPLLPENLTICPCVRHALSMVAQQFHRLVAQNIADLIIICEIACLELDH